MKKSTWIVLWIVAFLVFWIMGGYNWLVWAQETLNKAWGNVESQYQRRADLIDNLVATVRGAADQELEVLTQVVEARASATQSNININDAQELAQFQASQWELSWALSRLLVSVEAYPEVQSNETFQKLMDDLTWTENRVNEARIAYNDAVQMYNGRVRTFPWVIIANLFWFDTASSFQSQPWADVAPEVDFWERFDEE